jgi:nitric oxide synthase-interacting protein
MHAQMVVGRDSLRNFDACILCLQTARDPVAWYALTHILNMAHSTKGHIGCKECFYECILTQKKELQRLKDLPSVSTPSAADVKKDAEEAAKMKQFMAAQSALPGAQTGASRTDGKALPSFWIVRHYDCD